MLRRTRLSGHFINERILLCTKLGISWRTYIQYRYLIFNIQCIAAVVPVSIQHLVSNIQYPVLPGIVMLAYKTCSAVPCTIFMHRHGLCPLSSLVIISSTAGSCRPKIHTIPDTMYQVYDANTRWALKAHVVLPAGCLCIIIVSHQQPHRDEDHSCLWQMEPDLVSAPLYHTRYICTRCVRT